MLTANRHSRESLGFVPDGANDSAYALATETAEPLLFKGDDFGHTDIESAV